MGRRRQECVRHSVWATFRYAWEAMGLSRRRFLAGSAAVLAARGQTVRPLVAVFWEPGFPAVDIAPIEKAALEGPGVSFVGDA